MSRAASRGRRSAILFTALGSGLLVVSVAIFHERILEEWWISRLGARDPEDRAAAATKLGEVGSGRGARALLAILRERQGPGDAAVDALGRMFDRVEPRVQADIVWGLLASMRSLDDESSEWKSPEGFSGANLFEVFDGLKPRAAEVFAAFTDELMEEKTGRRAVAVLAKAWPHLRKKKNRKR